MMCWKQQSESFKALLTLSSSVNLVTSFIARSYLGKDQALHRSQRLQDTRFLFVPASMMIARWEKSLLICTKRAHPSVLFSTALLYPFLLVYNTECHWRSL